MTFKIIGVVTLPDGEALIECEEANQRFFYHDADGDQKISDLDSRINYSNQYELGTDQKRFIQGDVLEDLDKYKPDLDTILQLSKQERAQAIRSRPNYEQGFCSFTNNEGLDISVPVSYSPPLSLLIKRSDSHLPLSLKDYQSIKQSNSSYKINPEFCGKALAYGFDNQMPYDIQSQNNRTYSLPMAGLLRYLGLQNNKFHYDLSHRYSQVDNSRRYDSQSIAMLHLDVHSDEM